MIARPSADCEAWLIHIWSSSTVADRRPIVGRRAPDAEPITKTQKSSGDRKKNITGKLFIFVLVGQLKKTA